MINNKFKRSNLVYFTWIALSLIVFSSCQLGHSQSNLKAGYLLNYYDYDLFEKTIELKNVGLSAENYTERLGLMKIGHGIEFGYRRKIDDIAIDLSYSIDFASTSAQNGEDEATKIDLRRRHHAFRTGIESYFGSFGLGAAGQYNLLRLSGRLGADSYESLDKPSYFSTRVYLMYNLPGKANTSISLQPFVDIPIASDHSLDLTAALLEIDSQGSGKIPLTFGFKLIIYNGNQ